MTEQRDRVAEVAATLSSDPGLLQLIVTRLKRDYSGQLSGARSCQEFKQELTSFIDAAIADVVEELRLSDTVNRFRRELQVRSSTVQLAPSTASPAAPATGNGTNEVAATEGLADDENGERVHVVAAVTAVAAADEIAEINGEADDSQQLTSRSPDVIPDTEAVEHVVLPPKFSDSSPSQAKHHLIHHLTECQLPMMKIDTSPASSFTGSSTPADGDARRLQRSTDDLVAQAESPNQSQSLEYTDNFETSVEKEATVRRVSFVPGDVTAVYKIRELFTEAQARELFFSGPLDLFEDVSHADDPEDSDDVGSDGERDRSDDGGADHDSPRLASYDEFVELDHSIEAVVVDHNSDDSF